MQSAFNEAFTHASECRKDARLGNSYGIDGHVQLLGDNVGIFVADQNASKREHGLRLKLARDDFQEPLKHVTVVLIVPLPGQRTVIVGELVREFAEIDRT